MEEEWQAYARRAEGDIRSVILNDRERMLVYRYPDGRLDCYVSTLMNEEEQQEARLHPECFQYWKHGFPIRSEQM